MFNLSWTRRSERSAAAGPCRRRRAARPTSIERLEDRLALSGITPGMPVNPRDVTVMSQNLYIGALLEPVMYAMQQGDAEGAAIAVAGVWNDARQRDFATRAETFADQIAAESPALVGLQEVSQFIAGDIYRSDNTLVPNTAETLDYLDTLLGALESRGLHYAAVATTAELSGPFTALLDVDVSSGNPVYTFQDIQFTDRDVILARTDLPPWQLSLSNVQEKHFPQEHSLSFPIGGGQNLTIWRGWNSVDVQVCGQEFRFINAHLEDYNPLLPVTGDVQMAQAADLLAGPVATGMSVVLVGDFNSRADGLGTPTYQQILMGMGGFTDSWTQTQGADPGYSWSENVDLRGASVLEPNAVDAQRLDLVLYRGEMAAVDMERVLSPIDNADPDGPLWPSDHAGVAATLALHIAADGKEQPWAVVNDDPERPGETAVFVMGTSADDRLAVAPRAHGGVGVSLAPAAQPVRLSPSAGGHVYVVSGGGNDAITLSGIGRDAVVEAGDGDDVVHGGLGADLLYGGGGNDRLFGGAGGDVLLGGDGNDSLFGGGGNDVLLGGQGIDRLFGENGDDILLGGSTDLDANAQALWAVLTEWNARRPVDARIANLENGVGPGGAWRFGKASTAQDDADRDALFSGAGEDWLLVFAGDWAADTVRRDRVS